MYRQLQRGWYELSPKSGYGITMAGLVVNQALAGLFTHHAKSTVANVYVKPFLSCNAFE